MKRLGKTLGYAIDVAWPLAVAYLVLEGWWIKKDMTTAEGLIILLLLSILIKLERSL